METSLRDRIATVLRKKTVKQMRWKINRLRLWDGRNPTLYYEIWVQAICLGVENEAGMYHAGAECLM